VPHISGICADCGGVKTDRDREIPSPATTFASSLQSAKLFSARRCIAALGRLVRFRNGHAGGQHENARCLRSSKFAKESRLHRRPVRNSFPTETTNHSGSFRFFAVRAKEHVISAT
jgi:hypothetical protein